MDARRRHFGLHDLLITTFCRCSPNPFDRASSAVFPKIDFCIFLHHGLRIVARSDGDGSKMMVPT